MSTSKRMKYLRNGLVLATTLLLWNPHPACAFKEKASGAGAAGGDKASGITMLAVSGKVVETMDSGGYTYALVDMGSAQNWVALPKSAITVGSDISCQSGMVLKDFSSSTLHRVFESIVFSPGLAAAGGAAGPAQTTAVAAAPAEATKVKKAEGPNGYTVGEVFEKKASLANKPVAVQGKVAKVSRGIMGKNWLHLQDGTGSEEAGTNDLVVTTDSGAEVGDVVNIKGTLSLDRDFGSGYKYGIIVEGAEVSATK